MTELNFAFDPQLPLWMIAILAAGGLVAVARGMWIGIRGAFIRAAALVVIVLALLNPSAILEEREALRSVVVVVEDASSSQKLDGREAQTEAIRKAVAERFGALENFELREVTASDLVSPTTDASTALFRVLSGALQDVPPERVAGALLITDGQVHDMPGSLEQIGINAPVHALITGREDERDRRVVIEQAPRYGVVGEPYEIDYRITQAGFPPDGQPVEVGIFLDGEPLSIEQVQPGQSAKFVAEVAHGGKNIIEFRVAADPQEITPANNQAFVELNGIRENLRVLLVSGAPHPGERTWRNLLKSDPSVDLVHFTILRPPEKQDGTPINQLSLIAFPTRELFIEKIDEFDLIIFDRYRHRGILPIIYYENIARYVRDGGALLVAAGPEIGEPNSIAGFLGDVIPATPDGVVTEKGFKPLVTEVGLKHPVTRQLDGWNDGKPSWGRWFRTVGATGVQGNPVLSGADNAPVLVLNRTGEGRVALFLSDHPWLWARGFEGGGPHVQLLRRTAHWLMKEPELDEERLTLTSDGKSLTVERQTLGDAPGLATLNRPDGTSVELELKSSGAGLYRAVTSVEGFGLHSARNGELAALAHVGPPNPREFSEVLSTREVLRRVLEASRGSVRRADAQSLPRIVAVRPGAAASGQSWIGFENTGASVLKGVSRIPVFAGFAGLGLLLLALSAMWAREGR